MYQTKIVPVIFGCGCLMIQIHFILCTCTLCLEPYSLSNMLLVTLLYESKTKMSLVLLCWCACTTLHHLQNARWQWGVWKTEQRGLWGFSTSLCTLWHPAWCVWKFFSPQIFGHLAVLIMLRWRVVVVFVFLTFSQTCGAGPCLFHSW